MTRFLLVLHLGLLVLASTRFTVLNGLVKGKLYFEPFRYFTHGGWGIPYPFPYRLADVLTYLAAYALGFLAYGVVRHRGYWFIGLLGKLLCGVGFLSFALELSHWFVQHNRSFIVSAPIALFVLGPIAFFKLRRRKL